MPASDRTSSPVWCFSVLAASDAGLMARVLHEFAKRGLVPERFHGVLDDDDRLVIDVQVPGLSDVEAHHVADRLRATVHVERVLLATKTLLGEARA